MENDVSQWIHWDNRANPQTSDDMKTQVESLKSDPVRRGEAKGLPTIVLKFALLPQPPVYCK